MLIIGKKLSPYALLSISGLLAGTRPAKPSVDITRALHPAPHEARSSWIRSPRPDSRQPRGAQRAGTRSCGSSVPTRVITSRKYANGSTPAASQLAASE